MLSNSSEFLVTILTPTYNRASYLPRLYLSLAKQTCCDFEWIIVDDGSTDDTQAVVERFSEEQKLEIRYFRKENGGKHTAVNLGVNQAHGELLFIVDSDDYLPAGAIETIHRTWTSISEDKRFCYAGIGALKGYSEDKMVGTMIQNSKYFDITYLDLRTRYKVEGDKAEIYRTDLLKQYPFPVFGEERFLTEAVIWNEISRAGYPLRWINEIIYICQYLEDGLSNRFFELMYKNPQGYTYYHNQSQQYNIGFRLKLVHNYNYYMCSFIAGNKLLKSIKKDNQKKFLFLGLPLGLLKYIKKCKEINRLKQL